MSQGSQIAQSNVMTSVSFILIVLFYAFFQCTSKQYQAVKQSHSKVIEFATQKERTLMGLYLQPHCHIIHPQLIYSILIVDFKQISKFYTIGKIYSLGHIFLAAQQATYCIYMHMYSELCFSLFYRAQLQGLGEGERAGDRKRDREIASLGKEEMQQLCNVLNMRWWMILQSQGVTALWGKVQFCGQKILICIPDTLLYVLLTQNRQVAHIKSYQRTYLTFSSI